MARGRLTTVKGVRATVLLLTGALLAAAAAGDAQRLFQPGPGQRVSVHYDPAALVANYDGNFHFCRMLFRNGYEGDGDGWYVDYPRADENLSIRFAELTKAPVTYDLEGNPDHYVVRLVDSGLFH